MGCPRWTGVPLKDILARAGVKPGAVHVAFVGADFGAVATAPPMIRSIPVAKAMEPSTLVAWAMNGEPLPRVHGFPLRTVTPGWAGSASCKWLQEIRVLDAPFKGTYMDDSYRIPPYPIAPGGKMPPGAVMAEAWPVKSIITSPAGGSSVKLGSRILFEGKAWAGDNAVSRVDISLDEGVTWQRAQLAPQGDKYAWRQFSFEHTPNGPGYVTCLARASDDKGNVQPIVAPWNPLGYYWNGIHRVGVMVESA
jgi:DMSO/TMAO reductase YedYZ molybdopterin-dependent catalytic subunit